MSLEQSYNLFGKKKFKPNQVSKNVGCIAEFKKRAILKFCIKNGIKSYQYDKMFNSNFFNEIGLG